VLVDVCGLPGVADPLVTDRPGGNVPTALGHLGRQCALLLLVLVLEPPLVSFGVSGRRRRRRGEEQLERQEEEDERERERGGLT